MKRLIMLVALLALPLAVAACGNDDEDMNGEPVDDGVADTVDDTADDAVDDPTDDAVDDDATDDAPAEELRDVTVMLDWTPNTNHLGIFIANAEGYYEEAGLSVDIVEPGAGGVEQVIAQGAADFGISVQEAVIPAREQGVPVVSIAAVIEQNTSSLMALAETGIEEPADLEGHAYGGFGGALETELVRTLVECEGGDPDAVTFTEVGDVDYLVGMERGQYDFVWIFDGWDGIRAQEIEGADVNFIRFRDYLDCIPDWYTPLIITSESMIADEPEVVEAFLAATTEGYEFAIEDPGAAADILLEAVPELDEDLVRPSALFLSNEFAFTERQWGEQQLDIWVEFEAFLREAELTETQIDVEEAYTNEFLP